LSEYADRFGADPDRWWFLTGPVEDVHGLVTGSLKQAFVADESLPEGMRVTHSTRFVLVDGAGSIRGFFESGDGAAIESLVRRARRLGGAAR
jgi:protein SCO1/2